jgi:hypothetical protein
MPLTPNPFCLRPAAVCAASPAAPEALRTSTVTKLLAGSGAVVEVVVEAVVDVVLIAWVVDPRCAGEAAEPVGFDFRDGKITTANKAATMATTPMAAIVINQRRCFIAPERR